MKFKTINQHYQESECGRYLISRANVGTKVVYTLTKGGTIIGRQSCADFVEERTEALQLLKEQAVEDAK